MKLKFNTSEKRSQPDPYMCPVENGWAMYVTGVEGIGAYFSDTPFGTWEYRGIILEMEGCEEYWAPCMIYLEGWYYLYFSCSSDRMFENLHAARSKTPFGPFEDIRRLYPYFSIDPHVVKTEEGLFLWYCMNNMQCERVGTRIYVEKLLDPYTPSGNPKEAVAPTFDEEIFMRNRFEKGEDWHTVEGPFWLAHEGYQYLLYSGACYQNDTYHIGYGSAKSSSQDLTKVAFRKHTDHDAFAPLLTKNGQEEGVGHNSVIFYENEYYAVYHGRDLGEDPSMESDRRTARICRLKFRDGYIEAIR